MALFNAKVLKEAARTVSPAEGNALACLRKWAARVRSRDVYTRKESELDGDFKSEILQTVLGYRPAGDPDGQTVAKEYAVGRGHVDLALGRFGGVENDAVVAPFELKGADSRNLDEPSLGRRESPVEQAWRYARQVGRSCEWVLVSNFVDIRLYSYREGERDFQAFEIAKLDQHDEYARLVTLLGAESLLSGRTARLLETSLDADKAFGNAFYAEFQNVREDLITEIAAQGHAPKDSVSMAQTILDRILFIAFAEDRELLPRNLLKTVTAETNSFNPVPIWRNYVSLFEMIDRGGQVGANTIPAYNGGLFRRAPGIHDLDVSDAACAKMGALGDYDFAEDIDVTVMGHIFEQSLRDLEKHLKLARGETLDDKDPATDFRSLGKSASKVKKDGVVYTPPFVARFITDRTLGTHVRGIFQSIFSAAAKSGDPDDYDTLVFPGRKNQRKAEELAAWRRYLDALKDLRVVDPACGSGVFLVTAFDWLKREYDRALIKIEELTERPRDLFDIDREILTSNLYGVDVNAESVEITRLSLWLKTARRDKPLDALDHTIRVGDSLIEDSNYAYLRHGFTWESAFPEVFEAGGFDVVLGNPPYVRMELIKAMKPHLAKRYAVVADRADLYAYFFERGLRLLKPGGRLGYISSNTFFKTGSGRNLRDYIRETATVEAVADFGDTQIFEGVTTYPVIMVLRAAPPSPGHAFGFWNVPAPPDGDFAESFSRAAALNTYPQSSLGSGSWELESEALRALRDKITTGHPTLEETYGAPLRGVVTGLNAAFVIDRATRDRLVAEDPASEELLRPWLEGKDVRRWRVEPRDLFIIYIPKNRVDIDDYPAIRAHLEPFRERLEKRATQQEWFELQQAQENYVEALEQIKISYPHFNAATAFTLEIDGHYSNDKTYAVASSDMGLLAYLNSSVCWFHLKSLAPPVRGGYHELRVQYVTTTPIPNTLPDHPELTTLARTCQSAAAERLELQRALTRRIPDLCPPERRADAKLGRKLESWWELDFAAFRAEVKKRFRADIPLGERNDWEDALARGRREIDALSATIARAERRIDAVVYDLFGLDADEIALLESSI